MFQFRGGRLLASSFPDFPEAFRQKLQSHAEAGKREDIEFVIRVMSSYHGESFLNDTCKAVVRALPAGDPLLADVEVVLHSTGVLAGAFVRRGSKLMTIRTNFLDPVAAAQVPNLPLGRLLRLDRSTGPARQK
jgi:hypothetical protein